MRLYDWGDSGDFAALKAFWRPQSADPPCRSLVVLVTRSAQSCWAESLRGSAESCQAAV